MGVIKTFAKHNFWTDEEVAILRRLYPSASNDNLVSSLPGRHLRMIQCKANGLGLTREKKPKRTMEEIREAKRKHMEDKRRADPEAFRAYQTTHRNKNKDRLNAIRRAAHKGRLFWTRALKFRGITARDLARLWKDQRGVCALSGRKMGRDAQVDHKLPLARGGGDNIENLQWVTPEANLAKRDLTDDEFALLCSDVVRWIGRRIDARLRELNGLIPAPQ